MEADKKAGLGFGFCNVMDSLEAALLLGLVW
jgi:hypothetical protein